MTDSPHPGATDIIIRLHALLTALRDGPLTGAALIERLPGKDYANPDSARRVLLRDINHLQDLGLLIERQRSGRQTVYTLRGGTPVFTVDELRTLALVRDTFGSQHPQAAQVQALLGRFTQDLTAVEQQNYHRRQILRVPIQPAIDYSPYAELIQKLEAAISRQQTIAFNYKPRGKTHPTFHREVEPYEIEYYERHFYLVGWSSNNQRVHDFRLDRIWHDETFAVVPGGSWSHRRSSQITFRYRLAAVLAQDEISQRFTHQRLIKRLPNGDVIMEAEGRSDFFIRRTLLKYAQNAELLSPAWLRTQMTREVQSLAALYAHEPETEGR